MAFVCILLLSKLLRYVFFGALRLVEMERLYERSWFAITETCLALTIFRDEINVSLFALLTVHLFLKTFHWLLADRVDFVRAPPPLSLSLLPVRPPLNASPH